MILKCTTAKQKRFKYRSFVFFQNFSFFSILKTEVKLDYPACFEVELKRIKSQQNI